MEAAPRLRVVSFNILAPCYNRLHDPVLSQHTRCLESQYVDLYQERNRRIIEHLLGTDADIICLQEFWSQEPLIRELYEEALCTELFDSYYVQRTAYWSKRQDGLAVFIRRSRLLVEDKRDLFFHDCGDRVALLLVLGLVPQSPEQKLKRFICVNTHLLFPHDDVSSRIRLREATKLIGYIEAYKMSQLCHDQCQRGEIRLPVLVIGDFNGTADGRVCKFIKSQHFISAFEDHCQRAPHPAQALENWISHRNHLGQLVAVDHIFFSNPSSQTAEQLAAVRPADWTNVVYTELAERFMSICRGGLRGGIDVCDVRKSFEVALRDAFEKLDVDHSRLFTLEEFTHTLKGLDLMGRAAPTLTDKEIEIIVSSADKDEDGKIDCQDFCDRFWLAWELSTGNLHHSEASASGAKCTTHRYATSAWLTVQHLTSAEAAPLVSPEADRLSWSDAEPMGDLLVEDAGLHPASLADGVWPEDYTLSDHGVVVATFLVVGTT